MVSRNLAISAALVLLLALAFFAYSVHHIRASSPYPSHPDEAYLLEPAWNIARSGDLNPHFFNYGSLPIYLSALSLRVGAQLAQARGKIAQLSDVGPISFPYYDYPSISHAPRFVFALSACVALCALALIAYALGARGELLLLPLVALALNPLFQEQSYTYVNVDILATALVSAGLAHLLCNLRRESHWARWLAPALFTAAATATKYNAALLFVPFAAALARKPRGSSLWQLGAFALTTLLAFVLFEPFAALEFPSFWEAVQSEREHYRSGHAGHNGEPGLEQAIYYAGQIHAQLGAVLLALSLLGIAYGLRTRRTATLLVLLFPLCSFTLMIQQRVHFVRNLLPAVALLTAFSALGLAAVRACLERGLRVLGERFPAARANAHSPWLARAASACLLATLLWLFPSARPGGTFELGSPDSRRLVTKWLRKHAGGRGCVLLIPAELGLSPRTLEPHCALRTFAAAGRPPAEVANELSELRTRPETYLALPRWSMNPAGRPTNDSPDEWNALPERLALGRPVLRAGYGGVRMNRKWVGGNPRISLYRLEPPAIP